MVSASALSPSPPPIKKPPSGKLVALIGGPAALLTVAIVGQFEGKRNDPYADIVGVMTVCYGETRVEMRRYSDAECKAMLSDGLADFAKPVLDRNPELKGHDNQLAAAISLAYNIGGANYRKSTVARRFSEGRWKDACNAFMAWSMAGGKRVQGLVNRRNTERQLCLKGL